MSAASQPPACRSIFLSVYALVFHCLLASRIIVHGTLILVTRKHDTATTMKFFLSSLLIVGSAAAFAPVPTTSPLSTRGDVATVTKTPGSSSTNLSILNLAVGETAPDFALMDQNGKTVKRSSFKKPLVVYFYPADSTPGCTTQATSFDGRIKQIRKQYGADVVGISGQDVASKQKFAQELGLSFSILADKNDEVRKAFGVPRAAFGLFPGRVTYVLDKNGVCQLVYNELADAASHVDAAEQALQELKPANALSSFFG